MNDGTSSINYGQNLEKDGNDREKNITSIYSNFLMFKMNSHILILVV